MFTNPSMNPSQTLVLQALTNKRRRKSKESVLIPPVDDANRFTSLADLGATGLQNMNQALLDNNIVNILYQQPQLIPIIEQLIQQEQQQNSAASLAFSNAANIASGSHLTQRSSIPINLSDNPIEIESYSSARKRRDYSDGKDIFPFYYQQ